MAFTIKCPKCGTEMNADSRVCPVCGKRRLTSKDKLELILLIFLLMFGWLFIGTMRAMGKRMDRTIMNGGACCHDFIEAASAGEITWITS